MLDLLVSGGWVMLPLVLFSVLTCAIIAERLWSLQIRRVSPADLMPRLLAALKSRSLDNSSLHDIERASPLGYLLALILRQWIHGQDQVRITLEEAGRHTCYSLEKYLNTLGTIATSAPLLGLLGTVIGMIKVFTLITMQGVGNGNALSGGISEALLTTATGLLVAIPALIAQRYFSRKIDYFALHLEQVTSQFIRALQQDPELSLAIPQNSRESLGERAEHFCDQAKRKRR